MMELTVLNQTLPKIEINKDEIKERLTAELAKFENLVVTKDDIKGHKKTKAELNKLKKSVDDFRKKIKSEITKPVKAFEDDCKEIFDLIDEVVKPLDEQIKAIEEIEKEEKRSAIEEQRQGVLKRYDLKGRYADQLTIDERYLNKTMTLAKIVTDFNNRAEVLKIAQDKEKNDKQIIEDTCKTYDEAMILDVEAYLKLYEMGATVAEIVKSIHDAVLADRERKHEEERLRMQVELEAQQQAIVEAQQTPQPEPRQVVEPVAVNPEYEQGEILEYTLRISGTREKLFALKSFLDQYSYDYEKLA